MQLGVWIASFECRGHVSGKALLNRGHAECALAGENSFAQLFMAMGLEWLMSKASGHRARMSLAMSSSTGMVRSAHGTRTILPNCSRLAMASWAPAACSSGITRSTTARRRPARTFFQTSCSSPSVPIIIINNVVLFDTVATIGLANETNINYNLTILFLTISPSFVIPFKIISLILPSNSWELLSRICKELSNSSFSFTS